MPYSGNEEHMPGFMTLDNVVADIQLQLDQYDTRDALRFKQFVIRGMQDLYTSHVSVPKIKYLTVPASKVVALPDDFLDYVSVGYVDDVGKYIELGRNSNMAPLVVSSNGATVTNNAAEGEPFQGFPGFGNFGIAGGNAPSYYKVDYENRVIYLNRPIPVDDLCLQYRSTGIYMDSTTYFSRLFREPLIAFALWKQAEVANGFDRSERLDRKLRYAEEVEKLRAVEGSFTEQELRDVIYSTRTQTPRF